MQSGLYVTLSAQVALDRRLTTIATNIANQSTPGYRAEEVDFKALVSRTGDTPVAYVSHGETYISRQPGVPIKTDNPLDVAVQGDGWLALQTPAGTAYTRDGRMRMQAGGALQSVDGYPVLDAGNSPIILNPDAGPVTIAQDGMITQSSDWRHWSFYSRQKREAQALRQFQRYDQQACDTGSRFFHKRHHARLCRRSQRQPPYGNGKINLALKRTSPRRSKVPSPR
jgi:flagellar hook-basal body protein